MLFISTLFFFGFHWDYSETYYSHHSNDSTPTSPSMNAGSLDMHDSTFANGPSDKDPAETASGPSGTASATKSSK